MQGIRLFVCLLILLTSCEEAYHSGDVDLFNRRIADLTDATTPEELIKYYYSYGKITGHLDITVDADQTFGGKYEITLIAEVIDRGSVCEDKVEMVAELVDQKWIVYEIRENWRCCDGRGHSSWGIEPCK